MHDAMNNFVTPRTQEIVKKVANREAVSIEDLQYVALRAFDMEREAQRLREILAYEAQVVAAHGMFRTFPRSRRQVLLDQVRRMDGEAWRWESDASPYGAGLHVQSSGLRLQIGELVRKWGRALRQIPDVTRVWGIPKPDWKELEELT